MQKVFQVAKQLIRKIDAFHVRFVLHNQNWFIRRCIQHFNFLSNWWYDKFISKYDFQILRFYNLIINCFTNFNWTIEFSNIPNFDNWTKMLVNELIGERESGDTWHVYVLWDKQDVASCKNCCISILYVCLRYLWGIKL